MGKITSFYTIFEKKTSHLILLFLHHFTTFNNRLSGMRFELFFSKSSGKFIIRRTRFDNEKRGSTEGMLFELAQMLVRKLIPDNRAFRITAIRSF
ncbi:hypothetical protein BpHYR1_021033 [Brachionus plicatilis]|uniref:Uncharacterized protein n=1 Tax=Brachionus plicatilis TaxID=10195 RepID=A0A3M7R116_BRAPC|nr:hypothetical protein BpHYR1_021033 [Brachionus plicatilis]